MKTNNPGSHLSALVLAWSIPFLAGCASDNKTPATTAHQAARIGQDGLPNSAPAQIDVAAVGDLVPNFYDSGSGPAGEGRVRLRRW